MTELNKRKARPRFFICALAGVLLFSYELCRTTIDALFLAVHGASRLPYVWLAGVLVTAASVTVFNRLARTRSLGALLEGTVLVSVVVLAVLLGLDRVAHRVAVFLLYVWKDVHVVLLIEILWSFANNVFPLRAARRSYGLFCAVGSIASVAGARAAARITAAYGPMLAIAAPLVLLALVGLLGRWTAATTRTPPLPSAPTGASASTPMQVLRESPYLAWLLALVAATQIAISLVDYLFNTALAGAPAAVDRTAVMANVNSAISVVALTLQLATPWILKTIGVPGTLLSSPLLLGAVMLATFGAPVVLIFAAAKIASKALDYSLFRASKEILYIPLSYAERTRGKAIIDMFGYRAAKGAASVLLLVLASVGIGRLGVSVLVFAVLIGWSVLVVVVTRRYRRLVRRDEE